MKFRNLLIIFGVAGMATVNVTAGGLLSPKAADQQSKVVHGYNSDPSLTATGLQSAPPHVVESRTKIVPGQSTNVTSSLKCVRRMSGSPKMIGECANRPCDTMPCCAPTPAK